MKYATAITKGVLIGLIMSSIYLLGTYKSSKNCLDSEMQYYQAECIDHKGHKVCKTDEQLFYFNFTNQDNLTEAEIDSLSREL